MFLQRIAEVARQRGRGGGCQTPLSHLERLTEEMPPTRDFEAALRAVPFALIAEIKRASPSKGWLCPDLNPAALARSYERGGAAALSVLTEPEFFRGSIDDLVAARGAVGLPVLRKDFLMDPRQVYESRLAGADALLLIAAILSPGELKNMIALTYSLGMAALVEVHQENEMERALEAGARLLGINNRDLKDFSVSLETTFRLLPLVPPGVMVISESGINSAQDIARLRGAGVRGALIGEALITSPHPEAKLRELLEAVKAIGPSQSLWPQQPIG